MEIRSLKLFIKMNYETFSNLFENFADFLPEVFNIKDMDYELKKNWKIYEK